MSAAWGGLGWRWLLVIGVGCGVLLLARPLLEDIRLSKCDGTLGLSSHRSCRTEALALRFAQKLQSDRYGWIMDPDRLSDAELQRTLRLITSWDCISSWDELMGELPLHRDEWRALVERDPGMGFELPLDFFDLVQQCRTEAGRRSLVIHLTLNDGRKFTLGERGEWSQTP